TLEQAGAEGAAVDDRVREAQAPERGAVKDATPLALPPPIELVRVLEPQQRLGLAIAGLLSEVRTRVLPAVVPHERARRERDPVACLLEAPAHVHVVACFPVDRIEPLDGQQRLTAEGHVAAGNVLCYLVTLQDVGRLPRRGGDTGRQP